MREAGRKDGEVENGVAPARWRIERRRRGEACKESGAGEVSNNSLVRLRMKVRERMGGGLARQSESEWVKGFRVGKVSIYTRVFFF